MQYDKAFWLTPDPEVRMATPFRSTRDVIVRTGALAQAVEFYTSVLGFRISSRAANIVGFETGSFCLYVESGKEHSPVFDLLVPDVPAAKSRLLAAGCVLIEEDPALPRCYIRDPYGFTFNVAKVAGAV
jgi:predicted enzyme related to lactoylglutathione lyase